MWPGYQSPSQRRINACRQVVRFSEARNVDRWRSAGLDNAIISARGFPYAVGGVLPQGLRCRVVGGPGVPRRMDWVRGEITGFSMASRRRMLDLLMRLPWDRLAAAADDVDDWHTVFVTLTYPGEYPGAWERWKRDLRTWQKRLERRFGVDFAVWKLEEQKRGAPHFHILIHFLERVDVSSFGRWSRLAWYDVVGSSDVRHKSHGSYTVVAYENGHGKLMRYLSKYLGKRWDAGRPIGRVWGVWGSLPQVDLGTVVFWDRAAWVEFQRRVRKWGRKSRYLSGLQSARGIRLYGDGLVLCGLLRGLRVSVVRETREYRVVVSFEQESEDYESQDLSVLQGQVCTVNKGSKVLRGDLQRVV